jgi:hypothetical protein
MNFIIRVFPIVNFLLLLFLNLTKTLAGEYPSNVKKLTPDYKLIDVNTISAWITNYGSFFRNPTTGNAGFEWPKGEGIFAVYASGLWVGAKVQDDIRVAVAEYSYEYAPGSIDPVTHESNNLDDPRYIQYKYNKGETVDPLAIEDGCPPEVIGDQMLWSVYNDGDSFYHVNMATAPLGIEVQQTSYGWDSMGPVGHFIILRWLIINRSLNTLDSTYIAVWSDPDLGDSSDDLVGCDTILSLGYCYNSSNNDGEYGSNPPAIGYDYFQGPITPSLGDSAIFLGKRKFNYKNLPMTSFVYYNNSNENNGNPQTGSEVYNYMQAKWRDSTRITYGGTGINPYNPPTNYMFTGDPETGTGWLDSSPADRRFLMNSGPFTITPGDSQEVVTGVLIARGLNNLNSVTLLKQYSEMLNQFYYDSLLVAINPNFITTPDVFILKQNYPNPFNPSTTIEYSISNSNHIKLDIHNVLGKKVKTLVNEKKTPGNHKVKWDGKDDKGKIVPSGIYFYTLQFNDIKKTKRLLFIK